MNSGQQNCTQIYFYLYYHTTHDVYVNLYAWVARPAVWSRLRTIGFWDTFHSSFRFTFKVFARRAKCQRNTFFCNISFQGLNNGLTPGKLKHYLLDNGILSVWCIICYIFLNGRWSSREFSIKKFIFLKSQFSRLY